MSFTEAEVIYSARERTGNAVTDAVGSEYVSDQAIRYEMRENVLECCKAFGASTSSKELDFITVQVPTLAIPGAPTCAPSGSGGTLDAGTYGYRITALVGTAETLVGALGQAATTGSTSSIVLTWTAVAGATGYKVYGRLIGFERLLAKVTAATWTDTGAARPASGPPIVNNTSGWLQDYEIELYVGSDVLEVTQVLRSDAYRNETFLEPAYDVDPMTGQRSRRGGFVDQGLQQSAFEVMQAQERFREHDKYTWALVNIDGVRYLRLMPNPDQPVVVRCTYVSQANSIAALPDDARSAIENAACRAILDCILNRIKAEPFGPMQDSSLERRAFIEAMVKQRDRYEGRYMHCVGQAR